MCKRDKKERIRNYPENRKSRGTNKLYVSQTQDEYQTILFCGTLQELAKYYGIKENSVKKVIWEYKKNGWKYCPYDVVTFDENERFFTDLDSVKPCGTNRRKDERCKVRLICNR